MWTEEQVVALLWICSKETTMKPRTLMQKQIEGWSCNPRVQEWLGVRHWPGLCPSLNPGNLWFGMTWIHRRARRGQALLWRTGEPEWQCYKLEKLVFQNAGSVDVMGKLDYGDRNVYWCKKIPLSEGSNDRSCRFHWFFFYSDFKDKKVFHINRDKLSQRTERPRIRVEEHRKIKRYSTKGHGFPFLNKDVTQIPHKSRQFIHR